MELTDKEILTQLKLKRAKLLLEIQRIEAAIIAFEGVDINSMNELDLLAYMPDLAADLPGIVSDEPKALMYHKNMNFDDKIRWALERLNTGTAQEITDYIIRYEGGTAHRTKTLSRITYNASRMYNAGKIKAHKIGRKNIYSL